MISVPDSGSHAVKSSHRYHKAPNPTVNWLCYQVCGAHINRPSAHFVCFNYNKLQLMLSQSHLHHPATKALFLYTEHRLQQITLFACFCAAIITSLNKIISKNQKTHTSKRKKVKADFFCLYKMTTLHQVILLMVKDKCEARMERVIFLFPFVKIYVFSRSKFAWSQVLKKHSIEKSGMIRGLKHIVGFQKINRNKPAIIMS